MQIASTNETSTQHYYASKDSLFTKQDSTTNVTAIKYAGDSLLTITTKNENNLVLNRVVDK